MPPQNTPDTKEKGRTER